MSKRLQVLLNEAEYERIQEIARERGVSVSEWVRQVLYSASREVSIGDKDRKLAAIAAATQYHFPTGDIDQLLEEIERGYLGGLTE